MAWTGRALCVCTDRANKAGDGGGHRPLFGTRFCTDVRVLTAHIFEPSRTSCCTRPACGWSVLQASSHQNRYYALSSDQAWQTAHKRDALSNINAPRIFAARPIPGPSRGTRVRWPCGLMPPRSRVGYRICTRTLCRPRARVTRPRRRQFARAGTQLESRACDASQVSRNDVLRRASQPP